MSASHIVRRHLVVSLFGVAAGLIAWSFIASVEAAEKKTFKIGIIADYTGPFALAGKETSDSMKLIFKKQDYKNWNVELIEEDGAGSPSVALSKLRKLVEQDKVNLVVGPTTSAQAAAVKAYINERSVPTILTNAFARELTGPKEYSRWVLRVLETSDQANHTLATWITKNTPYKRIYIIASNFSGARASAAGFSAAFKAGGGTIVGEAYPAMGAPDLSPTLSSLDPNKLDAVYAWFSGTDAPRFLETYSSLGLKARLPIIGGVSTIVEEVFLNKLGEAALDVVTASNYSPVLDTKANIAFMRDYTAAYSRPAGIYAVNAYTGGLLIDAALKALDTGAAVTPEEIMSTLRRVAPGVETPTGKVSFDQYGQVITSIYIRQVKRAGPDMQNAVVGVIDNVSQEDTWGSWVTK